MLAGVAAIALQAVVCANENYEDEAYFARHFVDFEIDSILREAHLDGDRVTVLPSAKLAHYFSEPLSDSYAFRILGRNGEVLSVHNAALIKLASALDGPAASQPTNWTRDLSEATWFEVAGGQTRKLSDEVVHVEVVTLGDPANRRFRAFLQELVNDVLTPILPLITMAATLTVLGLRRALLPFAGAAAVIDAADRQMRSKRIPIVELPREAAPLAHSINKLMERADRALKSQYHIVSCAAHELRTPLSIMLMEIGRITDPRAAKLETDIYHMNSVTSRMLTLARRETTEALRIEIIDLGPLAAACVEQVRPLADTRGCSIHLVEDSPAPFLGEPASLHDAIRNLLENAIKHTPTGTNISVLVGPGSKFTIEDDGNGLGEVDVDELFHPFRRGKTNSDGAGLGLAIVKQAVDLNGGSIAVTSSAKGGARFALEFGTV